MSNFINKNINNQIVVKTVKIYFRKDNARAQKWEKQVAAWLRENHPKVKIVSEKPEALIVLGGDGTILEAVHAYEKDNPIILGLNLGHVGFLAAVREEKDFLTGLDNFFRGNYELTERMRVRAVVVRNGKTVAETSALNEIVAKHLFGVVNLEVNINDHPFQFVHGDGVMVSTSTGSTAYNLSAHGPIVMPNIKCLILKELLDHDIPTPSVVIKHDHKISIKIDSFREQGKFTLAGSSEKADVVLIADGQSFVTLRPGDLITITKDDKLIPFVELEANYFLKSLQEKFAFK